MNNARDAANILADIIPRGATEEFTTLLTMRGVRIERIVSHGHTSPTGFWYDQPHDEWVLLVQGSATLEFADGDISLERGSYYFIPAHRRHRVAWTDPTQPTVWLAIHIEIPEVATTP